mmetsp:Transcript_4718/g.7093  ORF Transcript_4718/g.7093 Transcript_4718/m.7093 type:complete len:163 (+) Transcript_4718:30-518(+)
MGATPTLFLDRYFLAIVLGLILIDFSYDIPVLMNGDDSSIEAAQGYYQHAVESAFLSTSVMVLMGIMSLLALFRLILLGGAVNLLHVSLLVIFAVFFFGYVAPAEQRMLETGESSTQQVVQDLTAIAQGHIALMAACLIGILLGEFESRRLSPTTTNSKKQQ